MRVTSRIAAGYAILVGLLMGLLAFEMVSLHRMQAINRHNSGENLQVVLAALQLMRDRDSVEDSVRQVFSNPSRESQDRFQSAREMFAGGLSGLQSMATSDKEHEEATRLMRFWKEFVAGAEKLQPQPPKPGLAGQPVPFASDLQEQLERLRAQTYSLYQVCAQTMASEAEAARKAGDRAEVILWFSAATALAVALCVFAWIVRSISVPLKNLTAGTRALTEGKEFYRLDTSRDDELSQIAKDFNELTRRLNPGDSNRNEKPPSS